ncbi:MAG: S41 family peptidase [Flavonifractor plautii]
MCGTAHGGAGQRRHLLRRRVFRRRAPGAGRGGDRGEPTSGKGYSQQTFPLPHGGAVAISTGAYFTGSGASLIGTGLTLDAEVYNTGAEDAQLAAALELLEIR